METLDADAETRNSVKGYAKPVTSGPVASSSSCLGARKWLHEPLLQFVLVGMVLFGIWRVVHPVADMGGPANRIELRSNFGARAE